MGLQTTLMMRLMNHERLHVYTFFFILYLLVRFVHLSATTCAGSTYVHGQATAFVVLSLLPYDLFPFNGFMMLPFELFNNMVDSCTTKVQRNV